MSRFANFFCDGVYTTLRSGLEPKPMSAVAAGAGMLTLPEKKALLLLRIIMHESAHSMEARASGAKVDQIKLTYSPIHIFGETVVDGTTPLSARRISLAGIGMDIGFILFSCLVIKRIKYQVAVVWLIYDLASFVLGADYKIYKRAKMYMERGK